MHIRLTKRACYIHTYIGRLSASDYTQLIVIAPSSDEQRKRLQRTSNMSHHLFLLSPSDTPLYSLTHFSAKPVPSSTTSPLAANLPSWSTSAFAGTLTALSGASSVSQSHYTQSGATVRIGGGQDRHVIQMIVNASLDVIEEVVRKESAMFVSCHSRSICLATVII